MLRIEDQIENATAMIKTVDYLESQIHKINKGDETADKFVEVAKETIEKSDYCVSKDFSNLFGLYHDIYQDCCCDIVYTLKDGSKVKRTYYAAGECVTDEFADLIKTDEANSSVTHSPAA